MDRGAIFFSYKNEKFACNSKTPMIEYDSSLMRKQLTADLLESIRTK